MIVINQKNKKNDDTCHYVNEINLLYIKKRMD